MKIKLTLEYNGGGFSGWQEQRGPRSVQGELEQALDTYLGSASKKYNLPPVPKVTVSGSGRTDAGVHARGQVASMAWPDGYPFNADSFQRALNGLTSRELSILSAVPVEDSFDARFSKHSKQYSYCILPRRAADGLWIGRAWRIVTPLDVAAMCRAAKMLEGTHDFTSFRASNCRASNPVRTIVLSQMAREGDVLIYTVQASGFLKQMIRILVGTLVLIGKKRLAPEDIRRIIDSRSRLEAGKTAPACGLTMDWVRYDPEPAIVNPPPLTPQSV